MAGHSKWAQIKRKKSANDQKKGQIFSKLAREISLAVVQGGGVGDPDKNIKLRMAIEKAKQNRMPKENIQRAIDKALGRSDSEVSEVFYEGFGPYGVGFIIYSLTDNKNRTINEIRKTLEKYGGKLGVTGSVDYLFAKKSAVFLPKESITEEDLFKLAEKVKADDIITEDDGYIVVYPLEEMEISLQELSRLGINDCIPELFYMPLTTISLTSEQEKTIESLTEELDNLDDVQKVFNNAVSI
ncbi:MAG: putative transcriptional regulatory protein [Patescibacteria group bacterium]|nr:MAG: putative transcriptional regulatory protein [Patescibacteria group bacterium]